MVDDKNFYFYNPSDFNLADSNCHSQLIHEILQLHLPDSENGNPMFFLSNYRREGILMDIDFLNPDDKNAEDKNNFYGE